MSSVEENNELVQPYYIINLNQRTVIDFAESISTAVEKLLIEQDKTAQTIIIAKPVKWKTVTTDITETGE